MTWKDLIPWNWGGKNVPVRRKPDDRFRALQGQMNDLFENFLRPWNQDWFGGFERMGKMWNDTEFPFAPDVDINDEDEALTITAEVPGMSEKDLDVSITREALTIKGTKRQEREEESEGRKWTERSFGSFERTIPLPQGLDLENAKAALKSGVLTLRLPKTEAYEPNRRQIPVQVL